MAILRTTIQNDITDMFRNATFPVVIYTDNAFSHAEVTEEKIAPTEAICNETDSTFAIDKRNGRSITHQRTSWGIEAYVAWPVEVLLDDFIRETFESGPVVVVASDGSEDRALLEFRGYQSAHPTHSAGGEGTAVRFEFNVTPVYRAQV